MGSQLNPYLMFDGNARQAMEFYRQVLGGKLEMGTVADFGAPDSPDAERIVHAQLDTTSGYRLLAWDAPQGVPYQHGTNIALYLGGEDGALREHFAQLAERGVVTMPLEKQPWGDEAGSLIDRFGITWMVNVTTE